MSRFGFHNRWAADRLAYMQSEFNYPGCNKIPLTQDEIIALKPGTPCYIISAIGVNLCMFADHCKDFNTKEDVLEFYAYSGRLKYKVKNADKTYNVFKVILD